MTDITYRQVDSLFTVFYPETDHGRGAWNELATQTDGTGKVLNIHAEAVIQQLRKTGYKVSKVKRASDLNISDTDLLSALQ